MKVYVICNSCSKEERSEQMKEEGPLYFNPISKSQSQKFECPDCKSNVSVQILV